MSYTADPAQALIDYLGAAQERIPAALAALVDYVAGEVAEGESEYIRAGAGDRSTGALAESIIFTPAPASVVTQSIVKPVGINADGLDVNVYAGVQQFGYIMRPTGNYGGKGILMWDDAQGEVHRAYETEIPAKHYEEEGVLDAEMGFEDGLTVFYEAVFG
jgi:hypothetical protein